MNDFKALQRSHELLLKSQQSGDDISEKVKEYIEQVKVSSSEIYQNAERDQLRSNLRYWASYLYEKKGKFPQLELLPPSTKAVTKQKRANLFKFGMSVVGLAIVVFSFGLFSSLFFDSRWNTMVQTPTVPSTTTSSTFRYGFDKDPMGWAPRTNDTENQAVTDVQQQIKFGQGSLELQIELIGQNAQKSKGEVFVNLSSNPPFGVTAPLVLEGKLITMLVYVPSDVIGDSNYPNFIQVFVEDVEGRSQYGKYTNLTSNTTGNWIIVSLRPHPEDKINPTETPTSPGFDPSKINVIGLKIGTGKTYNDAFRGSIWIDWVDWP